MTFAEGAATPAELIVSSTQAGYPARLSEPADIENHSTRLVKEAHALSRRMGSAAALALPVLIVEMGGLVVGLWPDQRAATSPGRPVMFETPTGARAGSPSQQNERKEEAMNNGDVDRRFVLLPKTIRYNEGLFRPPAQRKRLSQFSRAGPAQAGVPRAGSSAWVYDRELPDVDGAVRGEHRESLQVKALAEEHLHQIGEKIAQLQSTRAVGPCLRLRSPPGLADPSGIDAGHPGPCGVKDAPRTGARRQVIWSVR